MITTSLVSTRPAAAAALACCALLGGCTTLRDWTGGPVPAAQQPELRDVESREYTLLPEQQVVGDLYTLRLHEGDTLPDAARHFGLGHNDIIAANPGVDPWVPSAGSRVLLPMRHILPDAPREGIVLNLANMRLFHYARDAERERVYTYSVGIGREGWETPTGVTRIAEKKVRPSWIPPVSILREHAKNGDPLPRVVPPGPDNPLGDYALRLGLPAYLIHGTNKPYGVGMRISHGCVRLYPEDIERLYAGTRVGTPVRIVDQPYLAGWRDGQLYLEAHAPQQGGEKQALQFRQALFARLQREADTHDVAIDWARVDRILQRHDGIPMPVLAGSPGRAALTASAPAVAHPERFHGQPVPDSLNPEDWSIAVATFDDETRALRLAAMLNHQGPPIPARSLHGEHSYVVVAGPFQNRKEVVAVTARIRRDFELDAQPLAPQASSGEP